MKIQWFKTSIHCKIKQITEMCTVCIIMSMLYIKRLYIMYMYIKRRYICTCTQCTWYYMYVKCSLIIIFTIIVKINVLVKDYTKVFEVIQHSALKACTCLIRALYLLRIFLSTVTHHHRWPVHVHQYSYKIIKCHNL